MAIQSFRCHDNFFHLCLDKGDIIVVLLDILKKYLPNLLSLNAKELAKRVFKEAWIDASDEEINNFYNKYIKTLKLSFNDDGEVSLNISVK